MFLSKTSQELRMLSPVTLYSQWLKRLKTQKKFIESEIGAIFSGITSRITTKNLKIGLWGNFDLEPFLSFFAHFHLFLGWFGTPSSQYKVPLILVRDQRNLLRPFGSPKKWPTMTMEVVPTGITERRPILPFLLLFLALSVLIMPKEKKICRPEVEKLPSVKVLESVS